MASHKDLEAIDSVVSRFWVYSPDRLTVASCRSRRPAGRLVCDAPRPFTDSMGYWRIFCWHSPDLDMCSCMR